MTKLPPEPTDLLDALATLRAEGRQALDPVRFSYLETLAQRLHGQRTGVHQHLCNTLRTAINDYQRRCIKTQPLRVHTTSALRRAGLDQLKTLNNAIHSPRPGNTTAAPGSSGHGTAEMKSVQQFKQAWGRMKVQDQVTHALSQGPANAGPLNSHRLVLRTLGLMQDLSPAYLHHFMSHLDTMLQLDNLTLQQATKPAKSGKTTARKTPAKK